MSQIECPHCEAPMTNIIESSGKYQVYVNYDARLVHVYVRQITCISLDAVAMIHHLFPIVESEFQEGESKIESHVQGQLVIITPDMNNATKQIATKLNEIVKAHLRQHSKDLRHMFGQIENTDRIQHGPYEVITYFRKCTCSFTAQVNVTL